VCLEFFLKVKGNQSLLFSVTECFDMYYIVHHDKSVHSCVTCSVCLLMMGSESDVWGLLPEGAVSSKLLLKVV